MNSNSCPIWLLEKAINEFKMYACVTSVNTNMSIRTFIESWLTEEDMLSYIKSSNHNKKTEVTL